MHGTLGPHALPDYALHATDWVTTDAPTGTLEPSKNVTENVADAPAVSVKEVPPVPLLSAGSKGLVKRLLMRPC